MAKTDIELVYLAQAARDDAAFAELVRRHQGKLRAFLMRFTGDHSIVDDIAQMSLIKAHRAIGDFRRRRLVPLMAIRHRLSRIPAATSSRSRHSTNCGTRIRNDC